MSDAGPPPPTSGLPPVPSPETKPPPPRRGWLTAIMIIVGVILLLPGVCALGFGALSFADPGEAAGIMPFVMVGLLLGFGGIMLIRSAIRGRRI
jgi:hypothetical protein